MRLILIIIGILLISIVYAADSLRPETSCSAVGSVTASPNGYDYQAGSNFDVDIIVTNNNQKQVNFAYTARLSRDNEVAYTLTSSKELDPGTKVFALRTLFDGPLTFPPAAELGPWNFEFNGQIGSCVWQNEFTFNQVSCSDGKQNGDELGVDCGGTCTKACPDVIRFSNQLIYNIAYFKNVYNQWDITSVAAVGDAITYQQGNWIDGENILVSIPEETNTVATYGCCCVDCLNKYDCQNNYVDSRINVRSHEGWLCGWNINKR